MNISSNETSNLSSNPPTHSMAIPFAFWTFLGLETILIVVGNFMICWLVFVCKKLQTKQNIFIISLAVSDIFVGLSIAPCEYCHVMRFRLPGIECPVFCGSIISFDMIASVINLLLIATDRYFSIQKPFKYYEVFSKRRALFIVVWGWILAIFLTAIPTAWLQKPIDEQFVINMVYSAVLFSLTLISGVILFKVYYTIVTIVRRKIRATKEEVANKSAIKVCILSVVSFFVSWLPYCAVEILLQYNVMLPHEIMNTTYFVLLLNPCVNPFLYAYYRHDFRRAFCAWCARRKESITPIYYSVSGYIIHSKNQNTYIPKNRYFTVKSRRREVLRRSTRMVLMEKETIETSL